MDCDTNRVLDILSFWHKTEFFIPFDLDGRVSERDDRKCFWRNRGDPTEIAFFDPPEGKVVSGYTLYLGVFDKGDVQEIVRSSISQGDLERIEEQQRGDLEGRTCIASLRLDATGYPLFDSVEVSSLPWAVGRVRTGGLKALAGAAFALARQGLADQIRNFEMQRGSTKPDGDGRGPLRPAEIGALVKLFSDWAGFSPNEEHAEAVVEVSFKDAPKKLEVDAPSRDSDEGEDDQDVDKSDEYEIGILNSFYIDDLEMVLRDVEAGQLHEALRCYLTPVAMAERHDLYTADGHKRLVETPAPARINRGRWLGDPAHAMSLMQQFAIRHYSSARSDALLRQAFLA